MAEKKTAAAPAAEKKPSYMEEKVPVFLLKPETETENAVTVTINGYNYRVAYGKKVMVPRKVALILEESMRNQQVADEEASRLEGYHELGTV